MLAMRLGFGSVIDLIGALHPDVPRTLIDARLKYFQRLSFPSRRVLVGTGWRAEYGAEDTARLVLAFELLALGAAPGFVAPLVSGSWTAIESHLKGAWIQRSTRKYALPLFVHLDGLGGRSRATGSIVAGDGPELRSWLSGDTGSTIADLRSVTVIDALRIIASLDAAIRASLDEETAAEAMRGMDEWTCS